MAVRKSILISVLLLSAVLTACVDSGLTGDYSPGIESHYLEVNNTVFKYSAEGGRNDVSIATTESWAFSDYDDTWLSISPKSGNGPSAATVSANENPSGDITRTCIFYISSTDEGWPYKQMMSAEQSAASPFIRVSQNSLVLPGTASSITIDVTANINWSLSTDASWCTCIPSSDKKQLTISATENTSGTARKAIITLSGASTATITVTQNTATIVPAEKTLQFEHTGGTYALSIEAEADWKADETASWLDISPSTGSAGKSVITLSATPNWSDQARNTILNLRIGDKTKVEVKVSQRGIELIADEIVNFSALEETKKLEVKSNIAWSVLSYPNWAKVSPEKVSGNGTVSITVEENPGTNNRVGDLVLGTDGFSYRTVVKINQEGKFLSLGSTLLQFNDRAGSQDLAIYTNGRWSAKTIDSWITMSPYSGTGNSTMKVNVPENNNTSDRSGSVEVSVDKLMKSVTVQQQGKFFTVDNSDLTLPSKGGTLEVSIRTNDRWTANLKGNASWINLSSTSGDNSTVLKLTLSDNASVNQRSETLIINSENCQGVQIVVRQDARYLTVNTKGIYFFRKGGVSDPVVISTDGKYEVTASDDWFVIINGEGDSFTVKANENNTGSSRKGIVSIKLTDVKDGAMILDVAVLQVAPGADFELEHYGQSDEDWDVNFNGLLNLSIVGFANDESWDANSSHGLTVTIQRYGDDDNWDAFKSSGSTITNQPFGDDDNWDNDNTTVDY